MAALVTAAAVAASGHLPEARLALAREALATAATVAASAPPEFQLPAALPVPRGEPLVAQVAMERHLQPQKAPSCVYLK
jgi:hypothetical protein